jgi:hypothetical protein
LLLAAGGCSGTGEGGTAIADMEDKVLYLTCTPRLALTVELSSSGCPTPRADLAATLDGLPMQLDRTGVHPLPGSGLCGYPRALADLSAETGTTLDLELADSSQTVSVRIADYHPQRFVFSELSGAALHAGDTVEVTVDPQPDGPSRVDATFFASSDMSGNPAWMTGTTLSGGAVSFTIPRGAPRGPGTLDLCGFYATETRVESCANATCMLGAVSDMDCHPYVLTIE